MAGFKKFTMKNIYSEVKAGTKQLCKVDRHMTVSKYIIQVTEHCVGFKYQIDQ